MKMGIKKLVIPVLAAMVFLVSAVYGMENKYLSVGPSADGKGLTVTAKTGGGTKVDLYLTDAKGNARGKLTEKDIVLSDKNFIEIKPKGEALEIRMKSRFSFIPQFYCADVLYDPTVCKKDLIYIPAENFLINVNENKNGIMALWPPDGKQLPMLATEGKGKDRRFTRMRITFDKKSLFIAVFDHKDGLFPYITDIDVDKLEHIHPIHPELKKVKFGQLKSGWKFPFKAMWWTILAKPADNPISGMPSISNMVSNPKHGWDDFQGTYRMPTAAHADGQWVLELEKRYGPYYCALTYPRTRASVLVSKKKFGSGKTPDGAFTVSDAVFDTLGKKIYDRVIGRTDILNRGQAPAGEPETIATCGGSYQLWAYCRKNREKFVDRADALVNFMHYGVKRINEYREMAKTMIKTCKETSKKKSGLKSQADRIIKAAEEIEKLWLKEDGHYRKKVQKAKKTYGTRQGIERMLGMKMPDDNVKGYYDFLTEDEVNKISLATHDVSEKIRAWDIKIFDLYAEKTTAKHWTLMGCLNRGYWTSGGGIMDGILVFCRIYSQDIRQTAALSCVGSPEEREFALAVRKEIYRHMTHWHLKEIGGRGWELVAPWLTAEMKGSWKKLKKRLPKNGGNGK